MAGLPAPKLLPQEVRAALQRLARILAIQAAREDEAAEWSAKANEAVKHSHSDGKVDPVGISTEAALHGMRTPRRPSVQHEGAPQLLKRDLPK
jgi:hypothetical protein